MRQNTGLILLSICTAVLLSCNQKNTTSYQVPHEASETVISLKALSPTNNQVQWKTPKHWTELPQTGGIRIASFQINQNAKTAEVTITSFPGQTGGLLQNINRWRQQLNLDPIPLKEISSVIQTHQTAQFEYDLIQLKNTTTKNGMTVAIIRIQGQSWFIKLSGDLALVKSELDTFKQFVEGLSFGR